MSPCTGATHSYNFEGTPRLLDQTQMALGTEFGRTPRINDNDGRHHDNETLKCLLAGAGISGEETKRHPQ